MIQLSNAGIRFVATSRCEAVRGGMLHAFRICRQASRDRPRFAWILRHLNLEMTAGQRVGVVGVNGAGKSTLLKMLAGVYAPSEGQVRVEGRVHALLSLQSGFQDSLTGRENLRLRGVLLGRSRAEVEHRLPEMIAFSGLGSAIDRPVRTYSTGMKARLGFAISTTINPDVLLLDETLGVGDGAFRRRCEDRIEQLMQDARILLLCSHNPSEIRRHCSRVLWLDEGRIRDDGPPAQVLNAYEHFLAGHPGSSDMASFG